ncbi:MAG: Flp pilus assembly protein CpaB [Planctomycetota bacterium]
MRQTIALIISIILGIVAVFAMQSYISRKTGEEARKFDLIQVVAASRRIAANTVLKASDVELKGIPKEYFNRKMLQKDSMDLITGQILNQDVDRGDILFDIDIKSEETRLETSQQADERLVTVSVNQITGVAGLIQPKSRVDIFWTVAERGAAGSQRTSRTITLLSNVPVYAVDDRVLNLGVGPNRRKQGYTSITVSVNALEAALLIAAQATGEVTLALRHRNDFRVVNDIPGIDAESLELKAKDANTKRKETMEKIR